MILAVDVEFANEIAEKFGIEEQVKEIIWREGIIDLKEVASIFQAQQQGELMPDCSTVVCKSGDSMAIRVPYDALCLIMERIWGKSRTWEEMIKAV